jgi:hypothetical protein
MKLANKLYSFTMILIPNFTKMFFFLRQLVLKFTKFAFNSLL